MARVRQDLVLGLLVTLSVYLLHIVSPVTQSYDSRWTIHTTTSLLHQGNADLDEYLPLLETAGFYHIECVFPDGSRIRRIRARSECEGGHFYHFYPLGVPLMTAPAVAAMEAGLSALQPGLGEFGERMLRDDTHRTFLHGDLIGSRNLAELLVASFLIAASAGLLYAMAREWLGWRAAITVAFLFAFASPAWSTGSRALWMHGFSMLLLTVGFLLLRWGRRGAGWPWLLAGTALSFAFFVRPTNVVPLGCVGLWILWKHRPRAFWFAAGCLPVFALFASIHLSVYHSVIPAYSQVQRTDEAGLSLGPHVPVALIGNLVSPSRGLLVYLPLVLFSAAGLWLWWRDPRQRDWAVLLGATIAGHYLLISLYEDWFGGHGYGPRYFADITPLLILPLAAWLGQPWRWRWGALFVVCAAISLFMHAQGAWCQPCMEWDSKPLEIRESTWRLWDWRDPMFLRNFQPERALPAAGSLEVPAPGQPE